MFNLLEANKYIISKTNSDKLSELYKLSMALGILHEKNLVHGNINPEAILY